MGTEITLKGLERNLRGYNPFIGNYSMCAEEVTLALPCVQKAIVKEPSVVDGFLVCGCGEEVGTEDVYCRKCGQRLDERE